MTALDDGNRTPSLPGAAPESSEPAPSRGFPYVRAALQRTGTVCVLFIGWLGAVGYGSVVLLNYAYTPGRPAAPPSRWPAAVISQPASPIPSLVIFAHPQCPCSNATVSELAWIMARCRSRLDARVFFYRPVNQPRTWAQTDLWRSAAAIPGVRVEDDPGSVVSQMFHASTSGEALLYDSKGNLVFTGGLTVSRGHQGANDGREAVVALVLGASPRHRRTPVFGCSLVASE